jgi:CubicO group peptidase (beta-lactamase class C family)
MQYYKPYFMKSFQIVAFSIVFCSLYLGAQNNSYYFPPIASNEWKTVSPSSLDWQTDSIPSFLNWLETKNSKGIVVLHKGEIALEHYFGTFTRDSLWYWASAGKSLAAFMVGMAQEQGYLKITDKSSNYLGTGWTSCPIEKEDKITIWHQLTMTTGLETTGVDWDCTDLTCLKYRTDAGTRWFYHNAPYLLVHNVLEKATKTTINLYTYNQITKRIGMEGLWYEGVRYGKARDMARFGLLILNQGAWGSDTLLRDRDYFKSMVNSSQTLNPSYGYLWWLNGRTSYIQPGLGLSFSGEIVPHAPSDMIGAMGKNDQRIYVVPSMDLVVVRIGNAADDAVLALSGFDDGLWQRLMPILDGKLGIENKPMAAKFCRYNKFSGEILFTSDYPVLKVMVRNTRGQKLFEQVGYDLKSIDASTYARGIYLCTIVTKAGIKTQQIAIP